MNQVILAGRLTADPDIRYSQDEMMIARYTLAVDRYGKDKGADFIRCVAFDKRAQFAEKYLSKGMKIIISGRIQTGSYVKQDGTKVFTTEVIVNDHEFCQSRSENRNTSETKAQEPHTESAPDEFASLPDDFEGLPFA